MEFGFIFGRLNPARRIIIHHTAGGSVPSNNPYHFAIATDGTIHFGVDTRDRSGGTRFNNEDSIQIGVVGDFQSSNNISRVC